MRSKLPKAAQILRREGFVTLIKKIHNYYFCPSDDPAPKQHIQLLKNKNNLVAAEIGVWKGKNAEHILNELDIETLFLIDPYDAYGEYPERKSDPNKMSAAQEIAHDKLKNYDDIVWMEKYSSEAISNINKNLDYVYVDGNHNYEYVKADIETYYSLLNDGGIIAGDDINWIGVAQAVTEFAIEKGLQPHFEPNNNDWFFIKGRPISTVEPLPYSTEKREIIKEEDKT